MSDASVCSVIDSAGWKYYKNEAEVKVFFKASKEAQAADMKLNFFLSLQSRDVIPIASFE
jgi:hypothetical protein